MKYRINKVPSKDDVTYYIATSVRNGKNVSTKNIENIGKRSKLLKDRIDIDTYLAKKLDEYNSGIEKSILFKLNPNKKIKPGETGCLNAGSIFIKRIFDDIKLNETLDKIQEKYKFKYSLSDITLFLVANRIVNPDSKYGMYRSAIEKDLIIPSFGLDDIYRALDILEDNRTDILKTCYENTPLNITRDRRILYYDCTNTYFESEFEDDLRARGKGKKNEREPLVSLGLAMDASGIPLSYHVFKGSANEQNTLIPLEKEIINDFRQAKFIVITDAGLSSKENRCFNALCDRKYITTLPVRKMSENKLNNYIFDKGKEWITPLSDYKTPSDIYLKYEELINQLGKASQESNYKVMENINKQINSLLDIILYRRYKVLIDEKPNKYQTSKEDKYIEEDYLISYSLRYELRQKKNRAKLIEKARSLLSNPGKLGNHGINDPKQYISKYNIDNSTGEIIKEKYFLDDELIKAQEVLDGYYCVATNLTEDDNATIINAMKYRWFIEDSFKIMKQNFDFRPVNHSLQKRIKAHFFTCFLSLLFYRYIQKMCHESKYKSLNKITDEEILNTIRNYNLAKFKKDYYIPGFDYNSYIEDFESLFNVSLSNEIMTPAYVNKQIKKKLKDKI